MARTDSPDDLLLWIQKATAPVTGGAYFRSLVQRLAESLGVRVALITECLDDDARWVRTLAYWAANGFAENVELKPPTTHFLPEIESRNPI
ncbi:MAG: hypothetical protein ACLFRW_07465, partial [Halorhodospira sp.]